MWNLHSMIFCDDAFKAHAIVWKKHFIWNKGYPTIPRPIQTFCTYTQLSNRLCYNNTQLALEPLNVFTLTSIPKLQLLDNFFSPFMWSSIHFYHSHQTNNIFVLILSHFVDIFVYDISFHHFWLHETKPGIYSLSLNYTLLLMVGKAQINFLLSSALRP